MGRGRRCRWASHSGVAPFALAVRISMKRGYSRRIEMPDTREGFPAAEVPNTGADIKNRDETELLLGVLRSIEPYEACILEAEQDGDSEVAAFLRELRRQDLIRAREATRLLKRSLQAAYINVGKVGEPYVELSAGR